MNTQANWWQSFFQGVAVDMWLEALPPEHTAREADALAQALAVLVGAEVLDVPCGAGRLSLALAQRGYTMHWSAARRVFQLSWYPFDREFQTPTRLEISPSVA